MVGGDVILKVMLFRDNWRHLRAAESKSLTVVLNASDFMNFRKLLQFSDLQGLFWFCLLIALYKHSSAVNKLGVKF